MTPTKRDWRRERRTGRDLVDVWVSGFESQAEAARKLDMKPQGLWGWLNEPDRGWDRDTCRRVSQETGIPFIALMFKGERVSDLLHDAGKCSEAAA